MVCLPWPRLCVGMSALLTCGLSCPRKAVGMAPISYQFSLAHPVNESLYPNPAAFAMALQDRLAQDDLAVPVLKCREWPGRLPVAGIDVIVKGAKELLEGVGEALVVAAGVVGERPYRFVQERRIANEKLIGLFAVADP